MTNQLVEDDAQSQHILVDYEDLLKGILAEVQKNTDLFKLSPNRRRLIIRIAPIARAIATLNPTSPIVGQEHQARLASINFSKDFQDKFPKSITDIKNTLTSLLNNYLDGENFSLSELVSDLTEFKSTQTKVNFLYPFAPLSNISQQPLEINPNAKASDSALKLHKLTISVTNINSFTEDLNQGLENYLENELIYDQDTEEDLRDILAKEKDITYLRNFVNQEILGQLKREACLKYLEYIAENINESKHPDIIYLQDLLRRLKLLKNFFNNPDVADDYYQITYDDCTIDLKTGIAQSYAFNSLPIIPIITGYLGEVTGENQNNREFVFGLKLKFNGKVEKAKSKSVFAYHLDSINPQTATYKQKLAESNDKEKFYRTIFQRFCVYFFALASRCQPDDPNYKITDELNYDPVQSFAACLEILKGEDDQKKTKLLTSFSQGLGNSELAIEKKQKTLIDLLKKFLQHGTKLKTREYPVHIEIQKGIFESSVDNIIKNDSFLKNKKSPKLDLRYVNIAEARVNPYAFCQLTAKFTIEDIRYHLKDEKQLFSMEYDLEGIKTLPILFSPVNETVRETYNAFQNNKLINFPYNLDVKSFNYAQRFNYSLTFYLLAYICLKIITDEIKVKLFLPILRLHLQGKRTESDTSSGENKTNSFNLESQMRDYSKVLAHLLNMDHLSNSQGLDINNSSDFKKKNAWNSLYSVIPKNFSFPNPENRPTLDKVALIVVSSCTCDAKKGNSDNPTRIANLIGEIITFNTLPSGKIQVKNCRSLSANYTNQQLYSEPTIILDGVTSLYHQGYRHIFYVAKTPYTDNLHLTKSEDSDNLFFLSKDLIKYIYQDYQDLFLYPVFFDQYYVNKLDSKFTESLSLQDSRQLQELFNDPNQKSVVFFNLCNGIKVKDDNVYNGVISYSTLVGVYKDLLDDQGIRQNLIYNEGRKNDLLQYLTLLHFSRYEKSASKHSLKLNPYQHITGDDSAAKLSIFKHPQGKADFNLLAFLTEVRRVLISSSDEYLR